MASDQFQIIEVTDLKSRERTYKIFRRGRSGKEPPLASGLGSRALAAAKIEELEREARESAEKAKIA